VEALKCEDLLLNELGDVEFHILTCKSSCSVVLYSRHAFHPVRHRPSES